MGYIHTEVFNKIDVIITNIVCLGQLYDVIALGNIHHVLSGLKHCGPGSLLQPGVGLKTQTLCSTSSFLVFMYFSTRSTVEFYSSLIKWNYNCKD